MQTALLRIFGALWPLLFVPLIIALLKSGKIGPYEHLAFEIGEPMALATLGYATVYCAFWVARKEHATSAFGSAIVTILAVFVWQAFQAPA